MNLARPGAFARAWMHAAALAAALLASPEAQATQAQYDATCGSGGGCHSSPPDNGRRNAANQASFITWAAGGGVAGMAGVSTVNAASIAAYIESVYNTASINVAVPFQTATAIDLSPYVMFGQTSGLDRFNYGGLSVAEGTVSPASGVASATETITFTPAACRTGAASFTYAATNGSGNPVTSTRTINLTIANPTTGLAVGGAATASGQTGTSFTYSLAPTCPLLVTGYSVVGGSMPAGLALNGSGQITGTPTTVQPATSVTLRTSYAGGGTTDKSVSITITQGPPVMGGANLVTGIEGDVFAGYQIVATNGTTFTYGATGLPPGLTVDAATGMVSGTPTVTGIATASFDYTVNVTANNGSFTSNKNVTFRIGGRPVVNSAATASGFTGVAFSYQVTATKTPTSFAATGLPPGLSINTGTGLISGTPTVVGGPTNVSVTATNATGTSAAFALAITIALGPPVIDSGLMPSAGEGSAYPGYLVTATNPPHTLYGATGLPAGLSINTATGLISGTPAAGTAALSPYTVTLSVTNSNSTATSNRTLSVSQFPPLVTSAGTASGQTGVPFSFQITGSNAPTAFGATGLPAGLSVNGTTGLVSGTPTAVGVFNATQTVQNGSGSDAKPLVITIALGPPVVTSPAVASGADGFPLTYAITATNSPTSFAASGLPPGLTVNALTGVISGTPSANGTFNATVSATNGTGTGSQAVTFTIATGLPVIDSPLTATGAASVPFTYQITASNAPSSFNATGLPPGVSVNTITGVISGTPLASGVFNVTLMATNATGTGSRALTLRLGDVGPEVRGRLEASGQVGKAFLYPFTIFNGPVALSVTGVPPGITVDEVRHELIGVPTAGGTYTVKITGSNVHGTSTLTVTITIGFQVATAGDLAVEVTYETPKAIALPITGEAARIDIVTQPAHGLVTIAGTVATYAPALGYSGEDSFAYTVTNPAGTSAVATVRITIGTLAPIASAATMAVPLNTAGTADLARFIRASGLTGVSIAAAPAHGTVTVNGTKVTYTPNHDFFGDDAFTYIAYGNAGTSSPAPVSVSVTGRPDPTADPDVGGIATAQVASARRFSAAQAGNIHRRMESLHRTPPPRAPDLVPAAPPAEERKAPAAAARPGFVPVSLTSPLVSLATARRVELNGSTAAPASGWASGLNVWVAGSGQFGRRDGDGELSGMRFSTDGITVGIDRRFGERLALGLGIGYGRDETDVGSAGARSKAKGASFAFYGSFQPTPTTFVDAMLGLGRLEFDSTRHVAAVDRLAVGERRGTQAYASLSAGAEFRREGSLFSPYGRIEVGNDRLDRYSESGAGLYSLTYHAHDVRSARLAMGLRAETQHDTDFGRVVPRARIEYRRELDESRGAVGVSYADLGGGPEYSLTPTGVGRNSLLLGVGADFLFRRGLRIGLDYQAQRSSEGGNVQGVRLLLSQELDGRGLGAWTWQPQMFKDPVSVEAAYTFDDNVTRGRTESERLVDRSFGLSVGQPIPFKLGTNTRVVVTPSVGGEKFQRHAGLGRFSAGAQAELQYRGSGAFDAATYSLVGRAHYDRYESDRRTGPRYFAGVNVRRAITDRIDLFGEAGYAMRNGRSDVFRLREAQGKVNVDYTLGRRGVLYLAGEYRRGDSVSTGSASLVNVAIADVFAPDDAFDGMDLFAYRFDARTVIGTLGWNYPLGPRDSLDLSWRRIASTPLQRPSFDWGSLRYNDNQYSLVYLMRF